MYFNFIYLLSKIFVISTIKMFRFWRRPWIFKKRPIQKGANVKIYDKVKELSD